MIIWSKFQIVEFADAKTIEILNWKMIVGSNMESFLFFDFLKTIIFYIDKLLLCQIKIPLFIYICGV